MERSGCDVGGTELRVSFRALAAALVLVIGCGGGTEPSGEVVLTMQNLAGLYYGVTFTTEKDGAVTDQLRRGATIELLLYATGTTDGQLFIPADTVGGTDVNLSLLGTWQLSGNHVTLSHSGETFLSAMTLVFEETHLTGQTTIDDVTYRVVLAW
jgi:hypothetical protein